MTPEGYFEFQIGNLAAGDCGQIDIVDSVACINGILGDIQCTAAWITPLNHCFYSSTNTSTWSNSEISVVGNCISGSSVSFSVTNSGTGNMLGYTSYRLFEDGLLIQEDSLMLNSSAIAVISVPSTGEEYRLEVDQVEGYPILSNPNAVVQSCSVGATPSIFNSIRPNEDGDPDISIDCLPIVDSYDPNDKRFMPSALGADNFIAPNTEMDYTIRFQNTGSDTAYTVVIIDTISMLLDLSTFNLLGNSDDVVVEIPFDTIQMLKFTFNDINLPDSTTDLLGSQGFVRFELSPFPNLPIGTVIHNEAGIYFDFNAPIITNDAWYTIYDTFVGSPDVTVGVMDIPILENVKLYPNPTDGSFTIELPKEFKNVSLEITNSLGQVVTRSEFLNTGIIESRLEEETGLYLIRIITDQQSVVIPLVKN